MAGKLRQTSREMTEHLWFRAEVLDADVTMRPMVTGVSHATITVGPRLSSVLYLA